jgi:type VI secretion system protein ImpJ
MIASVAAARQRAADESGVDRLEILWAHGILSSSLALLNHFNQVRQVHPEMVYRTLIELAGHLHILMPGGQLIDLPPYDHDNLALCFGQLIQSIETLLRAVPTPPPGPLITIDLEQAQSAAGYPVLQTRSALDERLLAGDYRFYLVVEMAGERPERLQSLSSHLSGTLTIAAVAQIDRYIERAYGLRLSAEQRPAEAPPQPQALYFQLDQAGAAWTGIRDERSLAIHIPRVIWQDFKQLDVTLIAIHRQPPRGRR